VHNILLIDMFIVVTARSQLRLILYIIINRKRVSERSAIVFIDHL